MDTHKLQGPSLLPGLLFLLIVGGCAVSIGWGSSWTSSSYTRIGNGGTITITRNNESVRARVVGDEVQIVVLREGRLYGVDGLSQAQRRDLKGIESNSRVLVDDPKLEQWQGQLQQIHKVGEDSDSTVRQLADAAKGLPFSGLVDDAITAWVGEDADRAAEVLDILAELQPGKSTQRRLLTLAGQAQQVGDERINTWLQGKSIRDDSGSLIALANYRELGVKSAEQILLCIDEVHGGSQRAQVFQSIGRRLVADPAQARLLVKQIDDLYGSNRAEVALALLDQPDSSVEFAIQVLENIDDFYGNHRLRVYLAAGKKAIRDPRAPRLVASQLDELYGNDRYKAAVAVLDWEGSGTKVALGIIDELDEIYGRDRKKLIDRIIDGRFFKDGQVQRAVLRTVTSELYSRDRRRALTRMLQCADLDPQVRKLVLRALEDG